jgi:branched-chain amino acid transport system permease protein
VDRPGMNRGSLAKIGTVVVLVAVVFLLPRMLSGNQYMLTVLGLLAINILLVASLRSITLINEISLGQVGFALIGAYTHAILVMKGHFPFWPALILSGLFPAVIALMLGHPFLKVKGIYFSILTLLTAETFRLVAYYWTPLTGGTQGLVGIPSPAPVNLPFVGEVKFDTINTYYYIIMGVVLVALLIMFYLERAYISFQWRAIRDDNMLAGAVGVNVVGYKIVNFTVAAFMAGISGSLYAAFQHNLSPDTTSRFATTMSIYLLVYMVVGGTKSFIGPLIGTSVLTLLAESTRSMQAYQPMVTGAIAIVVMLFLPLGLAGVPGMIRKLVRGNRGGPGTPRVARQGSQEAASEVVPNE